MRGSGVAPSGNERIIIDRSGIHGRGAFARERIETGEAVLRCGGVIMRADQIQEGWRAMQIGEDQYLVETPDSPGPDDFLNHSCEPNVGFSHGNLVLYALRTIEPGEELFFDYSTSMNEPGWELECKCGAPHCRGVIQSYCDLAEADRRRLQRIALAYLRRP